jgi:hypothetical protein
MLLIYMKIKNLGSPKVLQGSAGIERRYGAQTALKE